MHTWRHNLHNHIEQRVKELRVVVLDRQGVNDNKRSSLVLINVVLWSNRDENVHEGFMAIAVEHWSRRNSLRHQLRGSLYVNLPMLSAKRYEYLMDNMEKKCNKGEKDVPKTDANAFFKHGVIYSALSRNAFFSMLGSLSHLQIGLFNESVLDNCVSTLPLFSVLGENLRWTFHNS